MWRPTPSHQWLVHSQISQSCYLRTTSLRGLHIQFNILCSIANKTSKTRTLAIFKVYLPARVKGLNNPRFGTFFSIQF